MFYNLTSELNIYPILDLADFIFVITNSNYEIILINRKGAEIFGYSKDELREKNLFEYILTEIPPHEFAKSVDNIEAVLKTRFGEEKIISWSIKEYKEKENDTFYIVFSGQDITRRKKDEKIQHIINEILEASNSERNLDEFFKFIHNSISKLMLAENFYISLYDPQTNMLTFPYFVDKMDETAPPKQFGNGLTELVISKGISILIDKKKDEELIAKGEVELIGSETEIWLGVPLKIQDKTIGAIVVQDYENKFAYGERDKEILELISYPLSRAIERKRVEQEKAVLIEKLQEMNSSKDKLFSLISHDLRSPFNSLLGFSEILTTEYESLTHEEIKEYLNVIYETSKNLYGMTNNLLQFSRFQMNRIEYLPKNLNLKKIFENNLRLLIGNAIKKQITVIIDLNPKIEVYADEEMLNSIVQNLISNAIKFTGREGEVKITAEIINFFNNPDLVEIKIQDTGIGMSKTIIDKIFKERVKSAPGTDREYGTGLGLLLVKEFIEKNKGTIKVSSKLHQGTTFLITLPLASKS